MKMNNLFFFFIKMFIRYTFFINVKIRIKLTYIASTMINDFSYALIIYYFHLRRMKIGYIFFSLLYMKNFYYRKMNSFIIDINGFIKLIMEKVLKLKVKVKVALALTLYIFYL